MNFLRRTAHFLIIGVMAAGGITTGASAGLGGLVGTTLNLNPEVTIGPRLQERLDNGDLSQTHEVIVSFDLDGPVTGSLVDALTSIGVSGYALNQLPMVGVNATSAQVGLISDLPDVRSIYFNKQLAWVNEDSRALTGVDRMMADANLRNDLGLPYSGAGVGVMINVSGIDATHPDLKFGSHVVQNVYGALNLASDLSGLAMPVWVEDVPDTDIGSGHGTHVAGTVAGTGAASSGQQAGVAPGAHLIGYGSGAVLFILDTLGAFDYALTHQFEYDIRVIQNSWGTPSDMGTGVDPDDPINIATKKLADRGVIVVFSAGNSGPGEGTITGNYNKAPWVVSVGAAEKNGNLAGFSSRGQRDVGGEFVMDGEVFEWVDEPTIVAPGVDIVSALATTGVLGLLDPWPDSPAFYALMSGTSMSGPHVAGVIALMLEANPQLGYEEVIEILRATATNMSGYESWEVGAGMVNAHAAVAAAAGARDDYGLTVNMLRDFNASVEQERLGGPDFAIEYDPATGSEIHTFEVGDDIAVVNARASIPDNTVAVVLTDPAGRSYGSGIPLPLLGENVATSAPGMAGDWTVRVSGIGAVAGVALDPLGVTPGGIGLPGTIDVDVSFVQSTGTTGLDDIAGHPVQGLIESAVANRLLDSIRVGGFAPNRSLRREHMADYLVMGAGVRQHRPTDGSDSFTDVDGITLAAAEAVSVRGGVLRDMNQVQQPIMLPGSAHAARGSFSPRESVSRAHLAWSMVQALGLENEALAVRDALEGEPITVQFQDGRIPVADEADVPNALRGHVQLAIDLNLVAAEFSHDWTVVAHFRPNDDVLRAEYAQSAVALFNTLR